MKRHSMFVATTLAGALAIATPAVAGGLLGGISGGAGGGVLGTAGGALSSPASNFGAGGVLGATSQFQGQVIQQPLTIQRPALPTVSPNFGIGAGSALDAAGQVQGEIAKPDLTVPRKATGAVQSVTEKAQSKVGAARDTVGSTSASAAGDPGGTFAASNRSAQASGGVFAGGSASAGRSSAGAEGSTQARVQAGY